ncbi:MAG: hypothetical protein KKG99_17575 [Bacteroidetes bacterium]|nr:hypothetical protein [Bacteroidota bacterium]
MEIPEIAPEEIKKILEFKSVIESDSINKALSATNEPYEFYEEENITQFLQQLDISGFNLIFDYQAWLEEQSYEKLSDLDFLQKADLDTLRKLMTAHIRTERFLTGHLKEQFGNGYMAIFFARLEELYQQM